MSHVQQNKWQDNTHALQTFTHQDTYRKRRLMLRTSSDIPPRSPMVSQCLLPLSREFPIWQVHWKATHLYWRKDHDLYWRIGFVLSANPRTASFSLDDKTTASACIPYSLDSTVHQSVKQTQPAITRARMVLLRIFLRRICATSVLMPENELPSVDTLPCDDVNCRRCVSRAFLVAIACSMMLLVRERDESIARRSFRSESISTSSE